MAVASPSAIVAVEADDTLLSLLKEELTDEEHRMFVEGFHAYLQHDACNDFVVDLDDVYEWLGFTRKDNAKAKLVKVLKEDADYIRALRAQGSTGNGLHAFDHGQQILMTVHGFKRFAMSAGTEKAKRVRNYYISMEAIMFQYTRRKLLEQQEVAARNALALQEKDRELEAAQRALAEQAEQLKPKTYEPVARLDGVYVMKEHAQLGTDIHKIGKAIDEKQREATFNTGSADGVRILYSRHTSNGKLVEDIAKHALRRYHYAREHYSLRVQHTVDVYDIAGTVVDVLASSYDAITRDELLAHLITELHLLATEGSEDGEVERVEPEANLLDKYLSLPADERGCVIKRVEGRATSEEAFKRAFKQYAEEHDWTELLAQAEKLDATVLASHGFSPPDPKKLSNVCMHCNQLARSGCCALYNATERRKKKVIMHMEMKPLEAED